MAKCLLVPLLLTFLFSTIFNFLLALSVDSEPMWNIVGRITSGKPGQWQVGTDPCATLWLSVGCESGRVTRLDFIDLRLSGTLHPSIAKLSRLQYIDLTGNSISGPLPSLANLTFLDTLILNDNAFSSIPDDFFSDLIRLQQVSMDNIPLAPWKLPSSLVASLNLTNLSASNASIIGTIPHVFAELTSLKRIVLSNNRIQGIIPESLTTLPVLQLLDVTNNNLSGKVPKFRSSVTLKLSGNHFDNHFYNLSGRVPL